VRPKDARWDEQTHTPARCSAAIASVNATPSAVELRRVFDVPTPPTVGLEEEVMLLHPDTLDLLPRAADVLTVVRQDPSVKSELPASQLELVTLPASTVGEVAGALYATRRRLVEAADGIGLLAAAGAHPFSAPEGELSSGKRYEAIAREYGRIARRQLIFGLHVHVAVRPAVRALAVYNALRSYLPELAALSANAPFHAGADTGLESIRPKLAENLPRQGIPPSLASLEEFADALHWAATTGVLTDPRQWWWELRLHPWLGTVEVRVCDAQTTVAETAALTAVIHALCEWLAGRHDGGDLPPPAPTWRIEENRWSACRHGLNGTLADLHTGKPRSTRERLAGLLGELAPTATRLRCTNELAGAHKLLEWPSAQRHRAVAAEHGLRGLVSWLVERFLDEPRDSFL
jgi:glutamate---cysteine ligase / carboxylate-amine ligase